MGGLIQILYEKHVLMDKYKMEEDYYCTYIPIKIGINTQLGIW